MVNSEMTGILGVLQARMSSSRLPGKVLAPIEGAPMIIRQLERIRRSRLIEKVVVATSNDSSDDVLVSFLESRDIECFRGELSDVLARYMGVLQELDPRVVVRLTADCPLTSASVIDQVISQFLAADVDYASNTLSPTYPDGLDVEVMRTNALRWLHDHSIDNFEREHVTLGIYRRPEKFKLLNVSDSRDNSELRWTVDEPADLEFVRWVYSELYETNPQFEYEDILSLLESEPDKKRTNAHAARNAALDGLEIGAMKRKRSD